MARWPGLVAKGNSYAALIKLKGHLNNFANFTFAKGANPIFCTLISNEKY
jgi:hypothetical protein